MSNLELIGLLAGALELMAVYYCGIKKKRGFVLGMLGNILWISFVLITKGSFGLLIVSPVAFILNIKGYGRWSADEKKQEVLPAEGNVKN